MSPSPSPSDPDRKNKFTHFTFWVVGAIAAAIACGAASRMTGCSMPSAGAFVVMASTVVGILGTDVVAHRIDVPLRHHSRIMESHLMLHMMPMALSITLLCAWPQLVGRPASWMSMLVALIVLALLYGAYLAWPLPTGERFGEKLSAVYNVHDMWQYSGLGAGIAVLAGLLTVAHGANLRCEKSDKK